MLIDTSTFINALGAPGQSSLFDLTLLDCFVERINISFGGRFQYLEKKFTESIFHFPGDCCFINRPTKILMLIECYIP